MVRIDKSKFAFGRIDKGTKIHILPLVPAWGTGTACGIFHQVRYIEIRLSIGDVTCQKCKNILIYRILVSEVEKAPKATVTEQLKSQGWVERPLFTPQQESYKRPRLVFNAKDEIRCAFFTLVVRTDALRKKFKGGVRAYVEKYGARCNRNVAVLCWMSTGDLEDPAVDIEESGLIAGVDYECFDAMSRVMAFDVLKKSGEDVDGEVRFEAEWLKGHIHNGGVMVYYAGA